MGGSEVELVDPIDHLADTIANQVALFAQRPGFGCQRGELVELRTAGLEFVLQPRNLVFGACAVGTQGLDHIDELADLLFETVDRKYFGGGSRSGHYGSPEIDAWRGPVRQDVRGGSCHEAGQQ